MSETVDRVVLGAPERIGGELEGEQDPYSSYSLADLVRLLHEKRQVYREAALEVSNRRIAFEATIAREIARVQTASDEMHAVERAVRERAVALYAWNGNKQPAPGVQIRVMRRLDYDPATALTWAKRTGLALSLDKATFEKIARATPEDVPFVSVVNEPAAMIAVDLGKVLEEGE